MSNTSSTSVFGLPQGKIAKRPWYQNRKFYWWFIPLLIAVPNALITFVVRWFVRSYIPQLQSSFNNDQMWAGFNIALGFLIVFRSQQAYQRWNEGGALVQQLRGEWFNAASSLIAFTSGDQELRKRVVDFQHLLIRLMSLLHCSALQIIADLPDSHFEVLSPDGIDESSLSYLRSCGNRVEVLMHWIQRITCENMQMGVLPVPAPVITRVFQELSQGMVLLQDARKLKEFPFPKPYVQMIRVLLLLHWILSPIANTLLVDNIYWAAILTFLGIFSLLSINTIACEIEMPYGDDMNDLPLFDLQRSINEGLWTLLERKAQSPPTFVFQEKGSVRRTYVEALPLRSRTKNLQETFIMLSSAGHAKVRPRSVRSAVSTKSLDTEANNFSAASTRSDRSVCPTAPPAPNLCTDRSIRHSGMSTVKESPLGASTSSSSNTTRSAVEDTQSKIRNADRSFVGDGWSDDSSDDDRLNSAASGQTKLVPILVSEDSDLHFV